MLLSVAVTCVLQMAVVYIPLLQRLFGTAALGPVELGMSLSNLREETVTYIVKAVDGYLIAVIMLIFALGLYEVFVSRLGVAEKAETGLRLLRVQGLDGLKDRVARFILLIFIIEFFQQALKLEYKSALDLLYLTLGILLIATAFFLSSHKASK